MHNIKLLLAYDGTNYFGWQKTPTGPSIEETLQQVLEQILQKPLILQAASRTDAGVHAKGQVVNFTVEREPLNTQRLLISVNQILPKDISVLAVESVPMSFHPTINCKSKIYHYSICLGPTQLPQHRFYSWHVPYALDEAAMRQAIPYLLGEHDFSAFCNVRKNLAYKDYVRMLYRLDLHFLSDNRLRIEVEGNHFLYKMVRNLVGILIQVGRSKALPEHMPAILARRNRIHVGVTAPAHGLSLHAVNY